MIKKALHKKKDTPKNVFLITKQSFLQKNANYLSDQPLTLKSISPAFSFFNLSNASI